MTNYYLGVDASKGYADFIILDQRKQTAMDNFQLDDTFVGHSCLHALLSLFLKDHPQSTLLAAIESTGGYENNWFKALIGFQGTLNLKTAHLNPRGVNNNSKAGLTRVTTDRISARAVAEYQICHPEKITYKDHDQFAGLRKRWILITMLQKQLVQLSNQLESLMYTAHPELVAFCKDETPQWVLKLMKLYPSAARLARANAKSVSKIPYITKERAQELISLAKQSVASSTDPDTEQVIQMTIQQMLHLNKTVDGQKKLLCKHCPIPEVALLKTFKGIGEYSAVGLMLEIQCVQRFSSAKKLASFFGIHPVFKDSGDGHGMVRMSKKGRREPRRILYMLTISAIQSNPLIRDTYQMHLQKGMHRSSAIGACMHKILRIVYGMLKNNTSFDPEIDQRHRQNAKKAAGVPKDKTRRYQDYDPTAPVSKRQNLKRRERKPSQSDEITENGIMAPVPTEA